MSAEIVRFSPDTFSRVSPAFSALISLRVSSAPASSFLPVISSLSIETSPSFLSLITTLSTLSPPDVIVLSALILNETGLSLSEYPRGAVSSISSYSPIGRPLISVPPLRDTNLIVLFALSITYSDFEVSRFPSDEAVYSAGS